MADSFRIGDPAIEVLLRRSRRAKRLVLRVSQVSRTPTLTLPASVTLSHARAFVVESESWMRRQLAAAPASIAVAPGVRVPFGDGQVCLTWRSSGPTMIRDGLLLVSGPQHLVASKAATFLREVARAKCTSAVERYAGRLGRTFGRITIRDPRSRWGSCSADGNLMFSWRLVLAPDAVFDYVVAHEVAHLAQMNHSVTFWTTVACLYGEVAEHRAWLRLHGPALMRFRFS